MINISEIMIGNAKFVPIGGKVIQVTQENRSINRYYLDYEADAAGDKFKFSLTTPDEYNNGSITSLVPYLILGIVKDPKGETFVGMMARYGNIYWYKYSDLLPYLRTAKELSGGGGK